MAVNGHLRDKACGRTIGAATFPIHRSLPAGFRLTPQEDSFFELFATLADHLVDGAHELANLVGAEHSKREAVNDRIREIEHSADESTHAIMLKVNSSFITPFDS